MTTIDPTTHEGEPLGPYPSIPTTACVLPPRNGEAPDGPPAAATGGIGGGPPEGDPFDPGDGDGDDDDEKRTLADAALEVALERYLVVRINDSKAGLVRRDMPWCLRVLDDDGVGWLAVDLAIPFRKKTGKLLRKEYVGPALLHLQGLAQEQPTIGDPFVRVAQRRGEDRLVVDLGPDRDGVVVIDRDGWRKTTDPGVVFRRSDTMTSHPEPERGGDIEELRDILNMTDADFDLYVGWCVAAQFARPDHPILFFRGAQGTGKSSAAKFALALTDPAGLTGTPYAFSCNQAQEDPSAVSSRWCLFIDNMSGLDQRSADALCRYATGDGRVLRDHYRRTASGVAFRRCVILTSIDPGRLPNDLVGRLLPIDLERIEKDRRQAIEDLEDRFEAMRPRLLGAIFDLAAAVLRELPNVADVRLERMAGFCRILAALDRVRGSDSLGTYERRHAEGLAASAADSRFNAALIRFAATRGEPWRGEADDLYRVLCEREDIDEDRPPADWPNGATAAGKWLARDEEALRQAGVVVTRGRKKGRRTIRVEWVGVDDDPPPAGDHVDSIPF